MTDEKQPEEIHDEQASSDDVSLEQQCDGLMKDKRNGSPDESDSRDELPSRAVGASWPCTLAAVSLLLFGVIASMQFHNHDIPLFSSSSTTLTTMEETSALENTTATKSTPSPTPNCSCFNITHYADSECCVRRAIVVHKMGVCAMIDTINNNLIKRDGVKLLQINRIESGSSTLPYQLMDLRVPTSCMDYREVVLVRNWYDALISGYLYHKSGQECEGHDQLWQPLWLDQPRWKNQVRDIAQELKTHPANDRNLCRYLKDETEENGMRLYMEFAWQEQLKPLLEFTKLRRTSQKNQTLFVCFENLTSKNTYGETVQSIRQFLFPGKPLRRVAPFKSYRGSHGTNHSHDLRWRLHELVEQIDRNDYNGKLFAKSAEYGCKGELQQEPNDPS